MTLSIEEFYGDQVSRSYMKERLEMFSNTDRPIWPRVCTDFGSVGVYILTAA